MAAGEVYAPGGALSDDVQSLQIGDDGTVALPEGLPLSDAGFEMVDGNLVMSWPDGSTATVEGFADSSATLIDSGGAQMSGDMAQQMAHIDVPAASSPDMSFDGVAFDANGTEMIGGTDGAPIGNVEDVSGSVFAVRVDGERVELNVGDPVYQGDILESGPDGSIGVILADETTFAMGEDGRMVLDEMVYDPSTQQGAVSISVLEGAFTFVSGQVAKTDPDAMTLDTPVATIGIRGTQVGINLSEGKDAEIVLMEEGDGFVGEVVVQNDGGVVILNQAFAGTSVGSFDSSPAAGHTINRAEFLQNFGDALKSLPGVHNANTYGITEQNLEIMIEDAIKQIQQEAEQALNGETATTEDSPASDQTQANDSGDAENPDGQQPPPAEAAPETPQVAVNVAPATDPTVSSINVVNFGAPTGSQAPKIVSGTDGAQRFTDSTVNRTETVAAKTTATTTTETPPYTVTGPAYPGDATTVQFRDAGGSFVGSDGVNYRVFGGAGADRITTGNGNDYIYSGGGNDVVNAGAGNDIIVGGSGGGNDTYIGGEGVDWVIYPSVQQGYNLLVNLGTAPFDLSLNNGGSVHIDPQMATDASDTADWIDTDTLVGIENAMGGQGNDIIAGTGGDNILVGGLGNDILFGGDGNDILIGGQVNNISTLASSAGFDGNDVLIGGAGYDVAMFSGSFGDYKVNIDQNNNLTITGPGGSVDTLVGIEELRFDSGDIIAVGLPPVVSVTPAAGAEDSAIPLNIDAILADGLGSLASITIADIPAGSIISAGTDGNGNPVTIDVVNGKAVLTPDQLAGVTITPPLNFGDDFALTVTAQRDIGFTSEPVTLTVNVSPVADAPLVTVSNDNIFLSEGQNATFDISAVTTDASENITSVQVSGIPAGGKLFIPVGDGSTLVQLPVINGAASIPVSLVGSVVVKTPTGYSDDYNLVISATSKESDGGSMATTSVTVHVDMQEEPVVTVQAASGAEDTAIPLDIAAVVDGGESIASITIGNIPDGAIISVGTDAVVPNEDGTVTLSADQLSNLSITPASNDDTDFSLSIVAMSSDGGISDPLSLGVTVSGVADAPVLGAVDVSGAEDTAIPLDISAALTDLDGSETLSDVTLSGIPDGAVISVVTDGNGNPITIAVVNGAVSVPVSQLSNLAITPPADFNGTLDLSVSVTTTEEGGDTATTTTGFTVTIDAVDDVPVVTVAPATGAEDTAIALDVSAAVAGTENVAFVSITDIPEGSVISVGTDGNGDPITVDVVNGTVSLTPNQLESLTITPPANSADDFNLRVSAVSTDGGISSMTTLAVSVAAVADAPTVTLDIGAPVETQAGHVYPLTIDAALGDADHSESLSLTVSLVNAPEGTVLSNGVNNGDGTWTLEPQQLESLELTVPGGATTDFALEVTAVSTELENQDTATTTQSVIVDVPSTDPGTGDDAIVGTDGSDVLVGDGSDNEIWGVGGHDLIKGAGGDDEIHGGDGSDTLYGEGGNDALFGDAGSDLLFGGGGNDVLNGGADQDYLIGGGGDDVLIGGAGNDFLEGGGGADTFIFDAESGSDIIKDIMEQDTIVFDGQQFHAEDMIFNENSEGDVEISFQSVPDTKVTLEGVKLSDLENHSGDAGSDGHHSGYSITETDGQVVITLDSDG